MRIIMRAVMSCGVALVFALSSGVGLAQQAPAGGGENEAAPKVKVERRGGKKVFRIETSFVIEGRIQKPNAFYVLQRSQINYDWAKLKQDFVPRIFETLKKSPF